MLHRPEKLTTLYGMHTRPKIAIQISYWVMILLVFAIPARATQVDEELRALLKVAAMEADSFEDHFDAQVWLVDMSGRLERFIPDNEYRLQLLKAVHRQATRAQLQPELVLSVIQIESHFNRYAISRVGAQGLMQVMPFWKNEIGRSEDNLTDMNTNLRYGCTILKHYLKRSKGDLVDALARYNGSLGKTVYPEKVLVAWEKSWFTNN